MLNYRIILKLNVYFYVSFLIVMIKYIYLVIIILLISLSCASKKGVNTDKRGSSNDIFQIGKDCIFSVSDGMDSKVGTAKCGEIVFDYDYGKYSFSGPVTEEESFILAFNANYYAKFFEIIHIEAKLNRLFRDSVTLVYVADKSKEDKVIFQCLPCNKVAKIKFRGRSYLYPFPSLGAETNASSYQISTDTTSGLIRKIFISKVDTLPSGLYLRENSNDKNGNKLSLTTKSKVDPKTLTDIFRSVVLK